MTNDAHNAATGLLLKGTAIVAGFTHLAFLGIFYWFGLEVLAFVNAFSIILHTWAFHLAKTGQLGKCWVAMALEVVAHSALAVWLIGWNSGFHFYMLLVIPVVVVMDFRPMALKLLVVSILTAGYLLIDALLRREAALLLPMKVLDGLHYFNVLATILILIFLAGYSHRLVLQGEAKLRQIANTDPLTQLSNRRALMDSIRNEELRMQRTNTQMSVVLCDVDHFKLINDTHGHDAGDAVLKAISRVLRQGVREVDHVARWGGEEFMLVLPGVGTIEAQLVAERLRKRIEMLRVCVGHEEVRISMTFGVSTHITAGRDIETTIARADQALYRGKHAGRNRVIMDEVQH